MKRPLKTTLNFFVLAVVMAPLMIDTSPKNTTKTNMTIWGSAGQYALIDRGCSGEILREKGIGFGEMGLKLSQENKKTEVGILAHLTSDQKEVEEERHDPNYGYYSVYSYPRQFGFALNPFVEIRGHYVGVGFGFLASGSQLAKLIDEKGVHFMPSFHLRFGNLQSLYLDASLFQHPWLYAGNYLRIGLGSKKSSTFHPWFGVGFGPADKPGFIARGTFSLGNRTNLQAILRLGESTGILEPAVGLGVTYRK